MYNSTDVTLDPRLLQVHALVPFFRSITGSRADMFASEIGQAPPLSGSEVRRIQTGMEREFGKRTFMVRIPELSTVIAVVNRSTPRGMFGATIATTKTVIYRNAEGRYSVLEIPVHCQNHQQLGFDYVRTRDGVNIQKGMRFSKETILAKSPSLDDAGNYKYGVNANIAFMSIPEVIQDGIVISESFAKKANFKGYMSSTLSFGSDVFPLNLYGDKSQYKIFPDIGDMVNPNGLIFAVRPHSPGNELNELDRHSVRIKEESDTGTYVPQPNARVIDVEVIHNRSTKSNVPIGMDEQCKRYWTCTKDYYREILTAERQLYKEYGEGYIELLEGPLHNLFTRAHAILHEPSRANNINFYNGDTILNEWTVNITVSYDIHPSPRFKAADDSGSKGVVVSIWPDENMPTDSRGLVADVIMDGAAKINRLNIGGLFEQWINGCMDTCLHMMREYQQQGRMDQAAELLNKIYSIVSPRQHALVQKRGLMAHVETVLKGKYIYLWCPTDNPVYYPDVIKELNEIVPPLRERVTYVSGKGVRVTTDDPVLVASTYFIFLEKIGDEYSAVSSPLLQPQGIPGKLSRADKYSSPGRPQATRAMGETEVRIVTFNTDPEMALDMLTSTNSPISHKRQVGVYLTADKPTAIEDVMQYDKFPRQGNKIVDLVNNSLFAGGFMFEYKPVEND